MKKLFLTLAVAAISMLSFAQESAADFKNAGNEALRAKNIQGALENFEKAISAWEAAGEEVEMATVYNAADCARKLNENDKAIELFKKCEAGDYKTDYCAYYIAKAIEKKGDIEGTKAQLTSAMEKFTEGKVASFIRKDLAKIYVNEAKVSYDKGSEILKEVASAKPEQYAEIQGRAKEEFKKALPIFEKAGEIDPTNKNVSVFINAIKDQLK